jgi:putative solute:sodium symporter small subunit
VKGTRTKQNASRSIAASAAYAAMVAAPMLILERHFGLRRLKRGMLTMLTAWIGYFVIISIWSRALNKVMVPVLDMPLGIFLVAQGTVIIFFASLVLLLRTASR